MTKTRLSLTSIMDLSFSSMCNLVDGAQIEQACQALHKGELVAFPTETVYGLGADASNACALGRLYAVKGRPTSHPVIVHISKIDELTKWAKQIPASAYKLAESFWPGPMTLVLPKADSVLDLVTGGQNSVGLRIPNHPIAQALLASFGGGIAAPSANRFGHLSPTEAKHVVSDLGDDVALVLDGGPCQVGIESTIVDLTGARPVILRPGMILPEDIYKALAFENNEPEQLAAPGMKTRAPGDLPSHYAPITPLRIIRSDELNGQVMKLLKANVSVAVLAFQKPMTGALNIPWLVASSDPVNYARDLYQNLRFLDSQSSAVIIVESIPECQAWIGIADRIKRASAQKIQTVEEIVNER